MNLLSKSQQTHFLSKCIAFGVDWVNFAIVLDENNETLLLISSTVEFLPFHFVEGSTSSFTYHISSVDSNEIITKALNVSGLSNLNDELFLAIYYDGYSIIGNDIYIHLFIVYIDERDLNGKPNVLFFRWFDIKVVQ